MTMNNNMTPLKLQPQETELVPGMPWLGKVSQGLGARAAGPKLCLLESQLESVNPLKAQARKENEGILAYLISGTLGLVDKCPHLRQISLI